MPTIFVVRPQTGNIGNDLIALGAEQVLQDAFGEAINFVTVPASRDGFGQARGGLSASSIYEINRLADGVVIGPGNMFENGSLFCEEHALEGLSVPLMVLGVSAGKIYDRTGELSPRTDSLSAAKIVAICRAAEPVVVRDEMTKICLNESGLNDISVGGCPSLFLKEEDYRLPARTQELAGAALISIRAPSLMCVPYSIQERLRRELRNIVELLRKSGRDQVSLLCHDYRDLAFAAEFPDLPSLYTEDVRQFLGWLRDCALSVTFRLHAFLPCLRLGTPSINLSYDQRALSLIETVGMKEWDINFIQEPDLLALIRDRLENLERL